MNMHGIQQHLTWWHSNNRARISAILNILGAIGVILLHGWMIFLYNIWISCGCWDNPKPKLWGAIIGYNLSMCEIVRRSIKDARPIFIASAATAGLIVNAYLLHYVTPIHFLNILNDNILVLIFAIPTILAPIYTAYFTIIRFRTRGHNRIWPRDI